MKLPQSPHRHPDAAPQIRLARKFRVFFVVAAIVLLLSVLKAGAHWFGLEFLTLNTLLASGIAERFSSSGSASRSASSRNQVQSAAGHPPNTSAFDEMLAPCVRRQGQ
jgi:hypothetical protein